MDEQARSAAVRDHPFTMTGTTAVDIRIGGDGRLIHSTLGTHIVPTDGRRTLIDLTQLTFIDPAGLVTLASIAERSHAHDRRIDVRPPVDGDCASYLARMRLGDILEKFGVDHGLPNVNERAAAARLVELRRFATGSGMDSVIEALVQTYVHGSSDRLQPLYTALVEIAENVVQHSGNSHGHVALQRFPRTGVVEFAVGDSGVGLRSSLRGSRDVTDDRVAISLAARRHESSMPDAGRGQGISRVIETAKTHRGTVRLASGRATGLFGWGHPDPQTDVLRVPLPGTVVHVRLSLEGAAS